MKPTIPTGVFCLPSGGNVNKKIVTMSDVDGIVVGDDWASIEPEKGEFDFTVLDATLDLVESGRGQAMHLMINVGGGDIVNGGKQPEWLYDFIRGDSFKGEKFFSFISGNPYQGGGQTVTIPVFWEPTLLDRKRAMLEALADHLRNDHPLIEVVMASYCNALTNDWNPGDIRNKEDGLGGTPQQRWLDALKGSGFSTFAEALIKAGDKTFFATHDAFPKLAISTSIGRIDNKTLNPDGAPVNGRNVAESIVNNAEGKWPGFVVAMKKNLNGGGVQPAPGGTTAWNDLYVLKTAKAAQNVWHAYNDDGCAPDVYKGSRMNAGIDSPCKDSTELAKRTVDTGKTYGLRWIEFYQADLLNLGENNQDPHIPDGIPPDVIHYAHTKLKQ